MVYEKQESDTILSTLDKGLHVLDILSTANTSRGLTLTELSRAIGMHRTTLFRILSTLQARRLVERDGDTDRYQIGLGVLSLASARLRDLDIRHVARPILLRLCEQTRESVYLAIIDGTEVVTVERFEGMQAIALRTEIGGRRPVYCTASGKAILAELGDDEIERILAAGMPPRTSRTITSPLVMRHHLTEVHQRGFALDDEERIEGVRCVAAPVFGYDGYVCGAISIAAPALRTPFARLQSLGVEARSAAREASQRMGFVGDGQINAALVAPERS